MKHSILILCALALAAAPSRAQSDAPATMLQLADGRILWGEIVQHDPSSLVFRRLDNGGEVRLPWSLLSEQQSNALRESYGYIDHSDEELLIEADRLVLDDGREIIGKIVNRTDDAILVKTATTVVPVPKARVRAAAGTVQVPVLEVYTREELYQRAISELVPDSAASQFDLGRFCERILDFAHATEHYQKAAALDASFRASDVQQAVARSQRKAAEQTQIDYLYKIDLARSRKKFDEAQRLADAFDQVFPKSGLRTEIDKRKKQIEKSRDLELRNDVVSLWHFWAARICDQVARDPNMTLEAAIDYIGDKAGEDIGNAVTADLQRNVSQTVETAQVRKLWAERKNPPAYKASYGAGTWLLGDEARKGLEQQKEEEAAASEKSQQRQDIEAKIKRYLENQAMAQKAKSQANAAEDHQKYWSTWNALGRKQWLLAYLAEHSKDFTVRKVLWSPCTDCGGTGVRETGTLGDPRSNQDNPGRNAGAQSTSTIDLIDCPTCHHVGVQRRVTYQ